MNEPAVYGDGQRWSRDIFFETEPRPRQWGPETELRPRQSGSETEPRQSGFCATTEKANVGTVTSEDFPAKPIAVLAEDTYILVVLLHPRKPDISPIYFVSEA